MTQPTAQDNAGPEPGRPRPPGRQLKLRPGTMVTEVRSAVPSAGAPGGR
jgi:hypothetical protein